MNTTPTWPNDCTTTSCVLPKRCKPDETLERRAGECCPRCVCKSKCPELDYDICTRGFKPQLQKASEIEENDGGGHCCDRIICVSASGSANDELTISVKETHGNDFYFDEADENSVEAMMNGAADEEDDLEADEDDPYAGGVADGGRGGKEGLINLNSFQYDSNQVLDDFTASLASPDASVEASLASSSSSSTNGYSENISKKDKQSITTPSVNYYDEQIKIDVKAGSNGFTASENEYYLDEKEYGKKLKINT